MMKPLKLAACCLLALAASAAAAAPAGAKLPAAARAVIERAYPDLDQELSGDFAEGDVNGDGIADLATVIFYEKDGTKMQRLLLLAGGKDRKYRITAQSAPWELKNREILVAIGKSSVFVTGRGNSYTDYWSATFQFKAGEGGFRMIGVDTEAGVVGDEDSKSTDSYNLLTGKTVHVDLVKKRRKETRGTLKNTYRIPLSEFSFDNDYKFE